MITSAQIRAARAALRLSSQELAERSGIAQRTIKRLEAMDGVPASHVSTLVALKAALEAAGVEFVGSPEDGPGIRVLATGRS
ncbi:helix-turn-helix domain-containing protein [Pleomorphomonas oryzae]|uniref:helix-turn-helix domain-containing protein n=1 Tax=Pleomorphomonas oryzae TaxID=261934 RepID=UPI00047B60E0|nr:helix-turn-helix transcriptional regulator [Pleomorphomonas oryzae]